MKYGFVFSQTDSRPMYLQLMEQITQRIAVGDWPPNTLLPSVRELAADIKVSVITVKRAYLELARDGVIVTHHGRGSFVSEVMDLKLVQKDELLQHLEQAARLARALGLSHDKAARMLKQYME